MPKEDTQFKPGHVANPNGRPIGGTKQCLLTLDRMLREAGNQEKLQADLQKQFEKAPHKFLLQFVYPRVPPKIKGDFTAEITGSVLNVIVKQVVSGDSGSGTPDAGNGDSEY